MRTVGTSTSLGRKVAGRWIILLLPQNLRKPVEFQSMKSVCRNFVPIILKPLIPYNMWFYPTGSGGNTGKFDWIYNLLRSFKKFARIGLPPWPDALGVFLSGNLKLREVRVLDREPGPLADNYSLYLRIHHIKLYLLCRPRAGDCQCSASLVHNIASWWFQYYSTQLYTIYESNGQNLAFKN